MAPVVGLFVGAGEGEEAGFLERPADQLQADGQTIASEAAGHREARQPGEVEADRVDVAQVHRERIRGLLALAERGGRRIGPPSLRA